MDPLQAVRTDEPGPALDSRRIRWDFPILGRLVHQDKPLAYLDNAATTQKPKAVMDALETYYASYNSNVHRALHALGEQATLAYEEARARCAGLIGAAAPEEVIFTRGTTESINLVAHSWGRRHIGEGDEIILTEMEHHSNLVPWQLLASERGARLRFVPVREDGTLDMEGYRSMLSPRVKLVAFTHVSNILGTVNPAREIIAAAQREGAVTLIDAAQSVPHRPVDVQALGCDFLACSGHKMAGPTGIGLLYGRRTLLEEMPPFLSGGEMIKKVTLETATWADLPHKFEAGTPHIAGAIGLGEAVRYLQGIGMEAVQAHESEITQYALERLQQVPGLRILGSAPDRGGVISFTVDDMHPHDIAQYVDSHGVAIRAGHGCAQPLLRAFGHTAVSRASFYIYTLREEIDQLYEALIKAKEFFSHGI
jgi:cysteine desulfurase/selenocysteine lyase